MSVEIFEHMKFEGNEKSLDIGSYAEIPTEVGSDKISSIKVHKGCYGIFYRDTGYRGPKLVLFEGKYEHLHSWNDKISSIKVFAHDKSIFPLVKFYQNSGYDGFRQTLAAIGQDTDWDLPFLKNDSISSLKVPEGASVVLYENKGFEGKSQEFKSGEEIEKLGVYGWNDKVSSVKIKAPNLKLVRIVQRSETETPTGEPIAFSERATNEDSQYPQTVTVKISESRTETISRDWENSIMVGLSATTEISTEADTGFVKTEVKQSITSSIESTNTLKEGQIDSQTVNFEEEVQLNMAPSSIYYVTITLTPMRYTVEVEHTFEVEGSNKEITQIAEYTYDTFMKGEVRITTEPLL